MIIKQGQIYKLDKPYDNDDYEYCRITCPTEAGGEDFYIVDAVPCDRKGNAQDGYNVGTPMYTNTFTELIKDKGNTLRGRLIRLEKDIDCAFDDYENLAICFVSKMLDREVSLGSDIELVFNDFVELDLQYQLPSITIRNSFSGDLEDHYVLQVNQLVCTVADEKHLHITNVFINNIVSTEDKIELLEAIEDLLQEDK